VQKIISALRATDTKSLIIKLSVFSVLFLLAFFYEPLVFVVGGFLAILIIVEYNYKSIVHLFFFSSWLYNYMIAVVFIIALVYVVAMTIKYCRETKNLFPIFISPIILIIVFSYVGERISWLLIFAYLSCIVLLKARDIGFKEITNFFIVGVLVGAFIGLLRFAGWPAPFVYPVDGIDRMSGLCRSPNVFYLFILCAISAIFFVNLKTRIVTAWHIPTVAVLTAFGFMTISRGFYIGLGVVCLFYGIGLLCTLKQRGLIVSGIMCMAILFGAMLVFPFTLEGLVRTTDVESEIGREVDIDNTDKYYDPGRIGIWKKNIEEWCSSPKTFFFGHGLTASDVWGIGEHNLVIHLLAKTGLVGLLLVISFFVILLLILYLGLKIPFTILPFIFLVGLLVCGLSEEMFPKFQFFMFVYFFILSSVNGCDIVKPHEDIPKSQIDRG